MEEEKNNCPIEKRRKIDIGFLDCPDFNDFDGYDRASVHSIGDQLMFLGDEKAKRLIFFLATKSAFCL